MSTWYEGAAPNVNGVRWQWGTYVRPPQAGFHLGEVMRDTGVWRRCCLAKAVAMAEVGCVGDVCPTCSQSIAVWPLQGGAYEPEVADIWAD